MKEAPNQGRTVPNDLAGFESVNSNEPKPVILITDASPQQSEITKNKVRTLEGIDDLVEENVPVEIPLGVPSKKNFDLVIPSVLGSRY